MKKLLELFESKAFDAGLLGTIAAAGAVFGFNVPVATIMLVLTPFMIAIGAHGWNDAIKLKAKLHLEHEQAMQKVYDASEAAKLRHDIELMKRGAPPPQSGFAKLGLLWAVVGVSLAVILVASCGANCKDPKNAHNAACVIENGVVDCTGISSLSTGVSEVTPIVQQLVKDHTDPTTGKIDFASMTPDLLQLAWKWGICIVAQVWNGFFPSSPNVATTLEGVHLDATALSAAHDEFNLVKQKLSPGYLIKVNGGTL